MKKQFKSILLLLLIASTAILTYFSCENNDINETYPITNDFRVLKVNYNGNAITGSIANFDPLGQMELIFSHGVNKTAFETAISISPAIDYTLSYDETNSLTCL